MTPDPLPRLRALCLALPAAHEVMAWGEPTFRVRNKLFAMFASAANHHGGGRPAVWLKAAPGNQEIMVGAAPDRFFRPPYVGPSGWVGVWLDRRVRWKELAGLVEDSYQLVAPKRLLAAPAAKAVKTAKGGAPRIRVRAPTTKRPRGRR